MVNNVKKQSTLCERYKPNTLDEYHNQTVVNEIQNWIFDFEKRLVTKKALIIYGNSGVGKTLIMSLFAKKYKYYLYNYDSSICRNKKWVQDSLCEVYESMGFFGMKRFIVIDDMDALTNTNDYGGLAEMVKMINPLKGKICISKHDKESRDSKWKIPIIFICNNVKSNKFTDLLKECNVIHVPGATQLEMYNIAKKCKLLKKNIWSFIPQCKGDVRFFLNNVQLHGKDIQEEKQVIQTFLYERLLSMFNDPYNMHNLIQNFYHDSSMFPVLINENIYDNLHPLSLRYVDEIALSISDADYIQNIFYKLNNELDDIFVYSSVIRPIYMMKQVQHNHITDVSKVRFPVVLGKNAVIYGNKQAIKAFYASCIVNQNIEHFALLRIVILSLFNNEDTLTKGLEYMIYYNINPDTLFSAIKVKLFHKQEFKNLKNQKYKSKIKKLYKELF